MRKFRTVLFLILFSIISGVSFGATPKWILLPVDSDKETYLDQENFESNLNTRGQQEPYQIIYWIRQTTLQKDTYFEYQMILQSDEKNGIARHKTLVSRYVGADGNSIAGYNHTGWERVVSDDPANSIFIEVLKYDQSRKNESLKESPKKKEDVKNEE